MAELRREHFCWTAENAPHILTNDDLQCRDCVYRTVESTIECEKYEEKPGYVIYNHKPCKYYQKKT